MVSIFDVVLLIILSGFVFYGFFFGFIRTLGTFIGMIIGVLLAAKFYAIVAGWVSFLFFGYNNIGKVIVFFLIFSISHRLVYMLFAIIDKTFHFFSIIPFLKTINKTLGAILGFATGALCLGLILFLAIRYFTFFQIFNSWLAASRVSPALVKFANVVMPMLPGLFIKVKEMI
jgi:membrane protein required for colicin V production